MNVLTKPNTRRFTCRDLLTIGVAVILLVPGASVLAAALALTLSGRPRISIVGHFGGAFLLSALIFWFFVGLFCGYIKGTKQ